MRRISQFRAVFVLLALALALSWSGVTGVAAQKDKPNPPPAAPASAQIIPGYPMTITVLDNTQLAIEFTNALVGQDMTHQFYSDYADGVYLWAQHDAASPMKVYGPAYMPGGHTVNAYMAVSNTLTGSGTPSDPWVVTTVNDVPGTKVRLTQETTYVNGAEFLNIRFSVQQIGGTETTDVALFHAADLHDGADEMAYGYVNPETGGIGAFFTPTDRNMYQQFVPVDAVTAYQEADYATIWDRIGDATAPGPGFNSTIMPDQLHDAAVGLQWNLTVPEDGAVTVAETAFFGPHEMLSGSFPDVASDAFYYDYVYYLGTHRIATGYADGTFRPGNNATRGQLSKMVVLAYGWPIDTAWGPHFADVMPDNPFYKYVETAYAHGVIGGYPCGGVGEPCNAESLPYFRWGANVTRAQTVKIIVLAQRWPIVTDGGPHFVDVPVGSPFYGYVETGYHNGIVNGYADGTFRPNIDVTRGQISKLVNPLMVTK